MSKRSIRIRNLFVALVALSCAMFASPAQAQQVVATVPLPGSNNGAVSLALDASDEILFVGGADAIYGIYVPNASIVGNVPVYGEPSSMAYSPATGQLYSTSLPNPGVNNKIIVINTKANPITTTTLHVGSSATSNPVTVALNPVNGKIYTANYVDQSVSVIDPSNNNSVTNIGIQTQHPQFIAFDPGTGEVYVTALGPLVCNPSCDGGLTAIDPTTNLITTTVQVGNTPSSVAVDPSSHNVYVANFVDGTVDVISPSQGYALTHTISTGPYTGPTALVLDSSGKVYAASQNTHSTPNNPLPGYVEVINPAQGYSVSSINVGVDPSFITFDSGVSLIAVANQQSNTVSYISPTSLTVTTTVAVGTMPNAMLTNGTYKGTAVANGDGTVSLIAD